MKHVLLRCSVCLLMVGSLTGCASWFGKDNYFTRQQTAYLKAQDVAPLQVPGGLNANSIGDDYFVPALTQQTPPGKVDMLPPGSLAQGVAQGRISKDVLNAPEPKAQTPAATPAVSLGPSNANLQQNAQGNWVLQVERTPQDAWSNLARMLDLAGYHVLYQKSETHICYILDTPSTGGKATKATPIYQVHMLAAANNNTQFYVTDNEGKALPATVAQRVLNGLQDAYNGKIKPPSFWQENIAPVKQWFKEAFPF